MRAWTIFVFVVVVFAALVARAQTGVLTLVTPTDGDSVVGCFTFTWMACPQDSCSEYTLSYVCCFLILFSNFRKLIYFFSKTRGEWKI